MNDARMSMMRLLFAAAHAARDDRALRRALRLWQETCIVPVPDSDADSSITDDLSIAVSADVVPKKGLVS